jgi:multicomponent Na+:H+ antiporter subunit A
MAAVLMLGVVGYSVSGIYVLFGAPDLALTQLLVETLTIALFALVLVKLPRRFGSEPKSLLRGTRMLVATGVGVFATLAAVVISSVSPSRDVADAYIDNAAAAGGNNVVNVILTNFRALDTLGEITVLAAAATGISALVVARKRQGASPQ